MPRPTKLWFDKQKKQWTVWHDGKRVRLGKNKAQAEKAFPLNTILASRDPLALDCVAVKIGGIDPFNVEILKTAAERGVGESDSNKMQLLGTPLEKIIKTWKSQYSS